MTLTSTLTILWFSSDLPADAPRGPAVSASTNSATAGTATAPLLIGNPRGRMVRDRRSLVAYDDNRALLPRENHDLSLVHALDDRVVRLEVRDLADEREGNRQGQHGRDRERDPDRPGPDGRPRAPAI